MEKLNIREFRIGNLVDRTDYICRVVGIESLGKEALILDPINYTTERFVVQDIKPIPLTEEWLLKFEGVRWINKDVNGIFYWFNGIKKYIKFVHTLQNTYFCIEQKELLCKDTATLNI